MLFFGDAEAYKVRHSGALVDALRQGVPVICPDFLLFRSVVSTPCPVGITYATTNNIPEVLRQVMVRRREFDLNFDRYFIERRVLRLQEAIWGLWPLEASPKNETSS
jgi:hypothetical protein